MIDLLKIAKTEADGGNLFEELSNLYRDSILSPMGILTEGKVEIMTGLLIL